MRAVMYHAPEIHEDGVVTGDDGGEVGDGLHHISVSLNLRGRILLKSFATVRDHVAKSLSVWSASCASFKSTISGQVGSASSTSAKGFRILSAMPLKESTRFPNFS